MIYKNQEFERERALYGSHGIRLDSCAFRGAADGESALKESSDIEAENTVFALRYPLWHTERVRLLSSTMTDTCRAPLWYAEDVLLLRSTVAGTKAIRECRGVTLEECTVSSDELCWLSSRIAVRASRISGAYAFFQSRDVRMTDTEFSGKYSFQYVEDAVIERSVLHTKDAFWHAKSVTVYDSVLDGEYLGWYSENLRLVRCHIKGSQPLCYARGLILEDCTMEGADRAFERSEVVATLRGGVESIKAPAHAEITLSAMPELLPEDDGSVGAVHITVKEGADSI